MATDKLPSRKRSDQPSPALTLLDAAATAMPRTLGDRVRIAAMGEVMRIAIDCRMMFGRGEASSLRRFDAHTCVGIFRALDEHWYSRACRRGGTYSAMWEAHHGHEPWIAPDVFVGQAIHDQARNNRVAPGIALLLPSTDDDDPDVPRLGSRFEVWWCTSFDRAADTITLCRYRLTAERRHPLTREGLPRRRCVFSRGSWAELFPAPSTTTPATPSEVAV